MERRKRFWSDLVSPARLVLACLALVLALGVAACSDEDSSRRSDGRRSEARSGVAGTDAVQRGQQLYQQECQSCHGPEGDRLPAAPLAAIDFLNSRGDATLLAVVSDGKGTMPGYGKQRGGPFDEEDVRAVVAYMNSKAGRGSTTLLAAQGEVLYGRDCESCHGPSGDRIPIAPLDAQGYLDARTDAQLRDVILNGTGTMRGFGGNTRGAMSTEEATAIASYLRYRVQAQTVKAVGKGRDLYVGNCLACHGTTGDRVKDVGLGSATFLTGLGDGKVITAISRGTKTGPAFGLEGGGAFTVPDIAALVNYLKSWSGLSATSALASGATSGLAGEAIFVQTCATCHGPTGDQVPGVQLRSPTFLSQKGKDVVKNTIESGNKKGMPAWSQKAGGPLSDAQVTSVVDFLFSVVGPAAGGAPAAGAAGGGAAAPNPFGTQTVQDFFGGKCAGCHGADRKGLIGPALLAERLTQPNDFYINTILTGRPGTPMPAWGQQGVTKEQATALVEWFKGGTPAGGGPAPAAGAPAAPAAGGGDNIFDGKPASDFFASKCAPCHGADRKGVIGPALLPERLTQPDQFYVDTILKGRPGTPMPAWGQQGVTPEQAAAMVKFLKTPPGSSSAAPTGGGGSTLLTSTAAPKPQSELFGKELFETTCALCHGKDGMGQAPCPLGSKEWLMNMSEEGLINRISRGKPPRMPTWASKYGGPLSDAQILSVAQYLSVMAK